MNNNQNEYKITWKKFKLHLKTVLIHKWYVFKYCVRAGIPWQGIVHDLSKFSPQEFWVNVKYATSGKSPIAVQKELFGYTPAWFHHKGRNKHHYPYWIDEVDRGGYMTRMPYKYSLECLCDIMAANRAYLGKRSNAKTVLDWWIANSPEMAMHPDNKKFISQIYEAIYEWETNNDKKSSNDPLSKHNTRERYNLVVNLSKYDIQVPLSNK